MTLQNHVNDLVRDTVEVSLPLFKPELVLCVTIVAMLLLKIPRATSWISSALLALLGSIVALWCALPLESLGLGEAGVTLLPPQEIFTGMLVYDSLTVYLRCLLLLFAVLFIVLTSITGMGRGEDGPDMYTLVLGATLGMCIMASANHLITIFLGVEMASVPSYVLAGIAKGRPRASEAALKYAVYGAGAAGVMLYGISLLAGVIGSAHLPTMAERLAAMDVPAMISAGDETGTLMVLALGGLMTMAGLAFKLSAVPYHFWCPDVFEGATAEVNAFLSVASKAAALALLVRVAFGFGISPTEVELAVRDGVGDSPLQFAALDPADPPSVQPIAAEVAAADGDAPVDEIVVAESEVAEPEVETAVAPLSPVRSFIVGLIAVIAMVTSTFGNLAAYGQTNIKRLLAYSTIAHAGYMMLPVAAAVALTGRPDDAGDAIGAMLFYASVYLFMNLGAFAIVAFLRDAMHSEEIADYAGLIRSAPFITIAFVVILFSLVGLPPLAGFVGKVFIFLALIKAGGPSC